MRIKKTRSAALLLLILSSPFSGCRGREAIDLGLLREARLALRLARPAPRDEPEHEGRGAQRGVGHAILGEVLAIFPGVLVPGLGHYYAGDVSTAKRLTRVGLLGEGILAAGFGVGAAGYAITENTDDLGTGSAGVLLILTGGVIGAIGVPYLATAWIYDMVDTPRAVLSGGRAAPVPEFVDWFDWGAPEPEPDRP